MQPFINYIVGIFSHIVDILNVKIIPGFPLSIFQLMCCTILIKVIFDLIFGGFKEIDHNFNFINTTYTASRSISNNIRKKQIERQFEKESNYKHNYNPKHMEK